MVNILKFDICLGRPMNNSQINFKYEHIFYAGTLLWADKLYIAHL
jgi:hypothetical protein